MSATAARVLQHATLPVLMFDAALDGDEAGTLDLRVTDLPHSPVMLRNEVRRRWRAQPLLVVRVDDDPPTHVHALLLELLRREIRLGPTSVERFDAAHRVVVKVSAKVPPPMLARLIGVRLRAPAPARRPDARRR